MPKEIQAKIVTVGRPLKVEVTIDAAWLERLKNVLRTMDTNGSSYPLQRYLEELVEADIVYREGISSRGPFLLRTEIVSWLQRRHAGPRERKVANGSTR